MTENQKARLVELSGIDEASLTEAQTSELDLLNTIKKQSQQLSEKESYIGSKTQELGELKKKLSGVDPEEKERLQKQISEKEEVVSTLTSALNIAKEANSKLSDQISGNLRHGNPVDQTTVDELEDKLLAAEGGKEAMEKAYESMTDAEASKFDSDLSYRKEVMSEALKSVGSDETVRSPWRKKEVKKEEPDAEARIKDLFRINKDHHRRIPGGGGSHGSRRDIATPSRSDRMVDDRTS